LDVGRYLAKVLSLNRDQVTKQFYLFLLIVLTTPALQAQDSVRVVRDATVSDSLISESRDTLLLKSYATRYSPRKALLYAAILPGLGQIYNKKYWKLPLVYGGFISSGYYLSLFSKRYNTSKVELFYNLDHAPLNENYVHPKSGFTTAYLRRAVDFYRRQRDFMIIIMGATYLLQIIDAHVDAHLKEFDLNPSLKVSIEPMMEQNSLIGRQSGVALVLRF
jgi:hypothetical protein